MAEYLLVFLSLVAAFAYALPLFLRKDRVDWCEPLFFVLAPVVVGTTLRTVYMVGFGQTGAIPQGLLVGRQVDVLFYGLLAMIMGGLAFSLGYALSVPGLGGLRNWLARPVSVSGKGFNLIGGVYVVVAIWSISVLFGRWSVADIALAEVTRRRLEPVASGPIEYTQPTYLIWGGFLLLPLSYLLICKSLKHGKGLKSVAGVVGATALVLGVSAPFFASMRTLMILPVVIVLVMAYYIAGGIHKWLVFTWTAIIALVVSAMQVLRSGVESVGEVFDYMASWSILDPFLGVWHFAGVAKTSIVVESVPRDLAYLSGRSLVSWAYAPIPRVWWPEKPVVRVGSFVGPRIFQVPENSGVPPGIVAELYLNFGWAGIILGMFLVGATLKLLYRTFRPYQGSIRSIILYAASVPTAAYMLMSNDLTGAIVNTGMQALPLLPLLLGGTRSSASRLGALREETTPAPHSKAPT